MPRKPRHQGKDQESHVPASTAAGVGSASTEADLRDAGAAAPRILVVERRKSKWRDADCFAAEAGNGAPAFIVDRPSSWSRMIAIGAVLAVLALLLVWRSGAQSMLTVHAEDGALFFGPHASERKVAIENVAPHLRGAPVQLVFDPAAQADALPHWGKELIVGADGSSKLVLRAPFDASDAMFDRLVHVLVGDTVTSQVSDPVRLVWLGDGAWRAGSIGIPGAGGRAVDPRGAEFAFELHVTDPFYVRAVEATIGDVGGAERRQAMLRDPASPAASVDGGAVRYTLALDGIDAADRMDVPVCVTVSDRAGNSASFDHLLRLDARLPAFSELRLEGGGAGPIAVVGSGIEPVLVARMNRACDLEWFAVDQAGQPLALAALATERDDESLRVKLGLPQTATAYRGTITVTAASAGHDSPAVSAARVVRGELEFRFQPTPLAIDWALAGGADEGESTRHTNCAELPLVVRPGAIGAAVVVVVTGPGGEARQRAVLDERAPRELTLSFDRDGRHHVEIRAHRALGSGAFAEGAEWRRELTVVRDTQAPRVDLVATRAMWCRADALASPWSFAIHDGGTAPQQSCDAVASWRLRGLRGVASDLEIASGDRAAGVGQTPVTWAQLGLDPAMLPDGRYSFELVARDRAGNVASPVRHDFEIANVGPELQWIGDWRLENGALPVVFQATDDNGVREVIGTLVLAGGSARRVVRLARSGHGDRRGGSRWRALVTVPHSWSGKQVELTCSATDQCGNSTTLSSPIRGRLPVRRAPATPVAAEASASPRVARPGTRRMRFVRGTAEYAFGGRAHAGERPTSNLAGITAVPDFYLDETEVTVAEFLAFVIAEDGYRRLRNWSAGVGRPNEERRLELHDRLTAEAASELPIRAVDWFEADAYARWVGKRLPTVLEWEYVVRGGPAYRSFSCASADLDVTLLNVRGQHDGPQPVDRGVDLTPVDAVGAGIRNLCSNVQEWTATAGRRGGRRFAAGASYRDTAYEYSKLIQLPPTRRLAYVGFRCASSSAPESKALSIPSNATLRSRNRK
ncbi:MAG: SUMF1/EgtB/PvdO family nonheme iron enzyme [bacterium]|nr:SUMF1/EgtB/PvdO family nonheme iron enzyme [bacterium]